MNFAIEDCYDTGILEFCQCLQHSLAEIAAAETASAMAVGVVYAGWVSGQVGVCQTAAPALALGIAIQNFLEGAIVSISLYSRRLCLPEAL